MIKAAIDRILELGSIQTIETDYGRLYTDRKVYEVAHEATADTLNTTTLSSLVQYIKRFMINDVANIEDHIVHVVNHDTVRLISNLNSDRKREILMNAHAEGPRFTYGTFMDSERFIISLQSMFADDPGTDLALIKKFAGTTTAGSVTQYSDDGVSQQATIKQGAASRAKAVVPSPCKLRPYRTFAEIQQPASRFVFRMKEQGDTVQCALFAADGDMWVREAMDGIREYLEKELAGTGVLVIS